MPFQSHILGISSVKIQSKLNIVGVSYTVSWDRQQAEVVKKSAAVNSRRKENKNGRHTVHSWKLARPTAPRAVTSDK
jgi:hypothetical protein